MRGAATEISVVDASVAAGAEGASEPEFAQEMKVMQEQKNRAILPKEEEVMNRMDEKATRM